MSDGLPPSMTDLLAPPAQPESSVLTEQPQRQVNFLTTGIAPPSDLYVSPMDAVRVETFSQNAGIPMLLKMRYVTPAGELQYEEEQITTVALPATTLQDFNIGEGFLLSVALVTSQSSVQRGRVYGSLSYIRAFGGPSVAFMYTLVQGYVTSLGRVSWPIIQTDYPLNGQGLPVLLTLTTPPAGSGVAYTVPAAIRARLMCLYFSVTTSATVGNRFVNVQAVFGGTTIFLTGSPVAQAASATQTYVCAPSLPSAQAAEGISYLPWPMNLMLPGGAIISINMQGPTGTDQLLGINLSTEEWIDM